MSKFLKYKWAWVAWALLFAVIEISAILDDDKDEGDFTLSHYLRRAIGTFKTSGKMTKANWAARGAIIALLTWLVPHLRLLIELF
jgi:hypothetical protein